MNLALTQRLRVTGIAVASVQVFPHGACVLTNLLSTQVPLHPHTPRRDRAVTAALTPLPSPADTWPHAPFCPQLPLHATERPWLWLWLPWVASSWRSWWQGWWSESCVASTAELFLQILNSLLLRHWLVWVQLRQWCTCQWHRRTRRLLLGIPMQPRCTWLTRILRLPSTLTRGMSRALIACSRVVVTLT
jgi:hypothetical protein